MLAFLRKPSAVVTIVTCFIPIVYIVDIVYTKVFYLCVQMELFLIYLNIPIKYKLKYVHNDLTNVFIGTISRDMIFCSLGRKM